MESYNNSKESFNNSEELFSSAIRAGKRTYFFDVKATRKNDKYLTITESKKVFDNSGGFSFEKHKIFLYKEDFDKFSTGLMEALDYIKKKQAEDLCLKDEDTSDDDLNKFAKLEFEDLTDL